MSKLNLQIDKRLESRSWMDSPSTPLTAAAAWNDFSGGPTVSGELISERTAMSISTVFTCVTLLSEAVASLPCKVMRRIEGGRSEATDDPLYSLLAYSPNPEMTAFTFWSTIVGCSALTGNAYAQVTRDRYGKPSEIWPLHPLKTEPVRMQDGTLAFRTSDGMKDGAHRIVKAADVLHFPLFSLDGIKGISPVTAARESFALAKSAEKFGGRWFGNGAHVPSILIYKGNKPDAKAQRELAESWQAAHGGSNSSKQGFLFGDWDVKTIGLSPEDSQFLATKNFQRSEIASMFHIPSFMCGDTTGNAKANFNQQQLSFVIDTLRPILVRIEQEVNRKLLAKTELLTVFDVTERLRADMKTTLETLALGRQWSLLTIDEGRKQLGMNPVGGDVGNSLMAPVNMLETGRWMNFDPSQKYTKKDTQDNKNDE